MTKFFLAIIFIPIISFGQTKHEYSLLIPANWKLKPLLDSINFIEKKPRLAIIEYLNSQKINPENYFIDSAVHKSGDTLYIQVWDIVALQKIIQYDKRKDSLDKANNVIKGKKLKLPKPTGNPGNCFTAYFDTKKNALITVEIWQ